MTTFKDWLSFWRFGIKNPFKVGAVLPSSQTLGRAMAQEIAALPSTGIIVELGAGTGIVTQALLDAGIHKERLIIIEQNTDFCALLKKRFPDLQVLCADARELESILEERKNTRVCAIVSSLPLLAMSAEVQAAIMRASIAVMDEQSLFVQYTYGLNSPLSKKQIQELNVLANKAQRIWRNLPPATIWKYQKSM